MEQNTKLGGSVFARLVGGCVACVCILCLVAPVHAEALLDEIVAVVEGHAVLRSELAGVKATMEKQGESIQGEAALLERRIEDLLIANHADSLGLHIGQKQIEETVRNIAGQNQMTAKQLYEAVAAQGLSSLEYRTMLREQMLRTQLVQKEVEPLIKIDEADLVAFMKTHPESYSRPPAVSLKFSAGSESSESIMIANFENSQSVDVDWQDLDHEVQQWVASGVTEGTIRRFEHIEAEHPYLWVQFVSLRPAELVALESVEDQVFEDVRRHKIERAFQHWLADLKADAWIERFGK